MRPILITGAGGFLGQHLLRAAAGPVAGAYHSTRPEAPAGAELIRLDITDREALDRVFHRLRPTAVIHAAAVANVDLCFTDRELGQRVNVLGTENVARAAAEVGARLVSVSTDLVFDGRQSMVHEEVRPEPICAYGETKLEAERRALALCPVAVVARSALLMGFGLGGRRTFFETSLETIRGGGRVRLFTDEHRTPISVLDAAGALLELARRPELGGIFHLAGPERVSRYELGLRMARAFGLPEERVIPISVADITFPDARPRDVSLSSERAQRELETKIPPLDEALRALLA